MFSEDRSCCGVDKGLEEGKKEVGTQPGECLHGWGEVLVAVVQPGGPVWLPEDGQQVLLMSQTWGRWKDR